MDFKLKTSVLRNCLVLMRRLAGWLSLKDTSQCKWQAVYVWWMLSTSWFIVVFSGCQPQCMYRNWKQCRNNVSAQQVLWTSTMGRDLRLMWTEVGGQILHNSVDVRNEWALCGVGKHCSDPVSRLNLLAGTALALSDIRRGPDSIRPMTLAIFLQVPCRPADRASVVSTHADLYVPMLCALLLSQKNLQLLHTWRIQVIQYRWYITGDTLLLTCGVWCRIFSASQFVSEWINLCADAGSVLVPGQIDKKITESGSVYFSTVV